MKVRGYRGWRITLRLLRGRRNTWSASAQRGDVVRGFVTPSRRAAWRSTPRMLDDDDGRRCRESPDPGAGRK